MEPRTDPRLLIQFGQRVRAIRKPQRLSQEKLGELAGLHRTYISKIERGKNNPTLGVVLRLAHGLGVSLSCLVEGVEKEVDPTPDRDQ